jgi:hypothetical protein
MAYLLAFPFRVSDFGSAVTVEQGEDAYYDEQIAAILLTIRGERPMRDTFGIPDIPFKGFKYSAFSAQVKQEMPEIGNLKATINTIDDRSEEVVVEYTLARENR